MYTVLFYSSRLRMRKDLGVISNNSSAAINSRHFSRLISQAAPTWYLFHWLNCATAAAGPGIGAVHFIDYYYRLQAYYQSFFKGKPCLGQGAFKSVHQQQSPVNLLHNCALA
jgi:hypothetical protein